MDNDMVEYLKNIRLIFGRLLEDIYFMNDQINNFKKYCGAYNFNVENKQYFFFIKYSTILNLFYQCFSNHLSFINIGNGGEIKLIKENINNTHNTTMKFNITKKINQFKYIRTSNNLIIDNVSINLINGNVEIIIGHIKYILKNEINNNITNIDLYINNQCEILSNIESSVITNINFISKYIKEIS
jgi:hypothetical protein